MKTKAKVPEKKAAAQRPKSTDALAKANKLIEEMAPIIEKLGECEFETSDIVSPLLLLGEVGDNGNLEERLEFTTPDGGRVLMSSSLMAMGKTIKVLAWRLHVCTEMFNSLQRHLESKLNEYHKRDVAAPPAAE